MPKEFDLKFLGTRCRQENSLSETQTQTETETETETETDRDADTF